MRDELPRAARAQRTAPLIRGRRQQHAPGGVLHTHTHIAGAKEARWVASPIISHAMLACTCAGRKQATRLVRALEDGSSVGSVTEEPVPPALPAVLNVRFATRGRERALGNLVRRSCAEQFQEDSRRRPIESSPAPRLFLSYTRVVVVVVRSSGTRFYSPSSTASFP